MARISVRSADNQPVFGTILTASSMTLDEFAAEIAHEIANPLAILYDQAARLRRASVTEIDTTTLLMPKVADTVHSTCKRIEAIMHGLRSININGETPAIESISVKELIDVAVDTARVRHGSLFPMINTDAVSELLHVECNSAQIAQVLINLLNNSSEATLNSLDRWISLGISCQDGKVEFSVTDSGTGIDRAMRGKIMQPFITTKSGGCGLGLSIAKKILDRHQSKLRIDGDCMNTRFCFSLVQSS